MRTTITIDDDLYQRTKALAAESGRTVGSVVEEALRARLALRSTGSSPVRPLPTSPGGLMPGVDLDDSAALLDLTENP
jgi:hypothetical protein